MTKYAVIANLEEAKSAHKLSDLPLHITLLGIFSSDKKPEYFSSILESAAKGYNIVKTKTIGRQNFGDEKQPTMVSELEKTKDFEDLHKALITSFGDELKTMNANFQPDIYRPHVTDQNKKSVSIDADIVINNLTLVEINDDDVFERHCVSLG